MRGGRMRRRARLRFGGGARRIWSRPLCPLHRGTGARPFVLRTFPARVGETSCRVGEVVLFADCYYSEEVCGAGFADGDAGY